MEAGFHFIFELVKISILGCIYATFALLIFKAASHYKPRKWMNVISPKQFWFLSGFVISVGLFGFMFTYWGNHGLGDSARIPIGYFKTVERINLSEPYIQNDKGNSLLIESFITDRNHLYAKLDKYVEEGSFLVWDLQNDKWKFYQTKDEYLKIARLNKYPLPDTFRDFEQNYSDYWHGWRLWFLP
jgi:hypothetical protein